jgi:hypothetical protein
VTSNMNTLLYCDVIKKKNKILIMSNNMTYLPFLRYLAKHTKEKERERGKKWKTQARI